MTPRESLIPELHWLSAFEDQDDSWPGPGPKLKNLSAWIDTLACNGHSTLVAAAYAAASTASRHWDLWIAADEEEAIESILDSDTPTNQLAAVSAWLTAPTEANREAALCTVDLTKQIRWFDDQFSDVWFDQPGMWAAEASENCVLSLTGDPHSSISRESFALLSILCSINAFRDDEQGLVAGAVETIRTAVKLHLTGMN